MRSSIVSLSEPTGVEVPPPSREGIDDLLDEELTALARRTSVLRDHGIVVDGDVVTLRMTGATPRFTRASTTLVVGMGLFDPVLEKSLVGTTVGEEAVVRSSEGDVSVLVQSSRYQDVPAVSDALVSSGTGGRFASVSEFRAERERDILAERLSERVEERVWDLVDTVIVSSDFSYDTGEVDDLVQHEFERCRKLSAEQGLVFDELSHEQMAERVGVETIEEFRAMVTDTARWRLATALLGARVAGRSSASIALTELDPLTDATIDHYRTQILERVAAESGAPS